MRVHFTLSAPIVLHAGLELCGESGEHCLWQALQSSCHLTALQFHKLQQLCTERSALVSTTRGSVCLGGITGANTCLRRATASSGTRAMSRSTAGPSLCSRRPVICCRCRRRLFALRTKRLGASALGRSDRVTVGLVSGLLLPLLLLLLLVLLLLRGDVRPALEGAAQAAVVLGAPRRVPQGLEGLENGVEHLRCTAFVRVCGESSAPIRRAYFCIARTRADAEHLVQVAHRVTAR
mmetsp:Transcript_115557/g.367416  ORF Transcript_115557/g.367416 Transcript_115557/m.367416 type:complete len:236 (-) Transcript_115557:41-748(-)